MQPPEVHRAKRKTGVPLFPASFDCRLSSPLEGRGWILSFPGLSGVETFFTCEFAGGDGGE
eukprot:8263690-Alexandrium_andersonii.AAC.1